MCRLKGFNIVIRSSSAYTNCQCYIVQRTKDASCTATTTPLATAATAAPPSSEQAQLHRSTTAVAPSVPASRTGPLATTASRTTATTAASATQARCQDDDRALHVVASAVGLGFMTKCSEAPLSTCDEADTLGRMMGFRLFCLARCRLCDTVGDATKEAPPTTQQVSEARAASSERVGNELGPPTQLHATSGSVNTTQPDVPEGQTRAPPPTQSYIFVPGGGSGRRGDEGSGSGTSAAFIAGTAAVLLCMAATAYCCCCTTRNSATKEHSQRQENAASVYMHTNVNSNADHHSDCSDDYNATIASVAVNPKWAHSGHKEAMVVNVDSPRVTPDMTCADLSVWLENRGRADVIPTIQYHQLDGTDLLEMSAEDLAEDLGAENALALCNAVHGMVAADAARAAGRSVRPPLLSPGQQDAEPLAGDGAINNGRGADSDGDGADGTSDCRRGSVMDAVLRMESSGATRDASAASYPVSGEVVCNSDDDPTAAKDDAAQKRAQAAVEDLYSNHTIKSNKANGNTAEDAVEDAALGGVDDDRALTSRVARALMMAAGVDTYPSLIDAFDPLYDELPPIIPISPLNGTCTCLPCSAAGMYPLR